MDRTTAPPPSRPGDSTEDEGDELRNERFGTGGLRALADRGGWAVLAEVANLAVTALVFKVLTDALDRSEFGQVQSVLAIALIVGPLSTFGANWSLIRNGVISRSMRFEVGRAVNLAAVGTTGAALVVAAVLVALPGLLPEVPRFHALLLLLGQMPAYWLMELAVTAAVAKADLKLSAQLRLVAAYFRIMAVVVFVLGSNQTLESWAWHFLAGNAMAALGVHLVLAYRLRRFPGFVKPLPGEFRSGLPYGLGNTTDGILSASDKPIMTQYHTGTGADGIYSAGYRIVTLGLVPMLALFKAQDRRFFRQGALGSAASHSAARQMAMLGLAATVPVAVVLFTAAPLMSLVINNDFEEAEEVIRLLAVLPVIKGFQFAFGNSLTAAGNQKPRLWLTGAAAVGNLAGNLVFIPSGSWRAAVMTTLVAEVFLAAGFLSASGYYARRR